MSRAALPARLQLAPLEPPKPSLAWSHRGSEDTGGLLPNCDPLSSLPQQHGLVAVCLSYPRTWYPNETHRICASEEPCQCPLPPAPSCTTELYPHRARQPSSALPCHADTPGATVPGHWRQLETSLPTPTDQAHHRVHSARNRHLQEQADQTHRPATTGNRRRCRARTELSSSQRQD